MIENINQITKLDINTEKAPRVLKKKTIVIIP